MRAETAGIIAFVTLLFASQLARCDPTSAFAFHPKPVAPAATLSGACESDAGAAVR